MTENAMNQTFDITRFCGKNDFRYYINQPIVHGGFIYATNGHICVRVPAQATDTDTPLTGKQPAKLLASLQKMFADQQDQRPADLPDLSAVTPCVPCHGAGSYMADNCASCDGNGEFDHDGNSYTCKSCDGEGHFESDGGSTGQKTNCKACNGLGYPFKIIPVGDSFFSQAYLKQLEHLPGLQAFTKGAEQCGMFTFDGGVVLLMPCRQ